MNTSIFEQKRIKQNEKAQTAKYSKIFIIQIMTKKKKGKVIQMLSPENYLAQLKEV